MKFSLIKLFLTAAILTVSAASFAEDKDKKNDNDEEKFFSFEAGIKMSYSRQSSNTTRYYKPFAEATFQFQDLSITPSYAGYLHYQITDGLKKYSLIKFNQAGIGAGFNITDSLEIKAEIKGNSGDQNYKGYEFSAEATLDMEKISISGSYSKNSNTYTFTYPLLAVPERKIENAGYSISFGTDIYINAKTIFNADFDIRQSAFIYNLKAVQDQEYKQYMLRLGASHKLNSDILIMAGLDGGRDDADYKTGGADFGIKVKLLDHVKLSASAMFLYNMAPVTSGGTKSARSNPFSPSTDSYSTLSIGAAASIFF